MTQPDDPGPDGELSGPEQIVEDFKNDELTYEQASLMLLSEIAQAAWSVAIDVQELLRMAQVDDSHERVH